MAVMNFPRTNQQLWKLDSKNAVDMTIHDWRDDMRQMFFLQLKCYPNVNVDALLTMDEINVHSCHTKENSHADHHQHYPSTLQRLEKDPTLSPE